MRMALGGGILLAVGLVLLGTGAEPPGRAVALGDRVWPILLFVTAITLVTEFAAAAGVFTAIAGRLARWGRGRGWLLWGLVCLLCTVTTVFFSLDATAVLITPIVVRIARRTGLPILPFAVTTIWLANTASLLLPVSNLTNLLAHGAGAGGTRAFVALSAAPAVAAVLIPVVLLAVLFRRELSTRFTLVTVHSEADPVLFRAALAVLAALLPALVSGLPVWISASAAAVILAAVFAVRRPQALRLRLVPWSLLAFAGGLFLIFDAAHQLGLGRVLGTAAAGGGPFELFRLAGLGALAANGINNLPAYLALAPSVAGDPIHTMALLVGTNCGPLVTPWASLATLLWHHRLAALGVAVPWGRFARWGLVAAPLTVAGAAAVLTLLR